MKCRIDGSRCKVFLNFGKMPVANGFLKQSQKKREYFFNLKAAFNKKLSLFQIVEYPSPKKMFNKKWKTAKMVRLRFDFWFPRLNYALCQI